MRAICSSTVSLNFRFFVCDACSTDAMASFSVSRDILLEGGKGKRETLEKLNYLAHHPFPFSVAPFPRCYVDKMYKVVATGIKHSPC